MTHSKNLLVALLASALLLPSLAFAHHSHSSLSRDDTRLMTGVVTEYLWRSPHVYIKANILNAQGEIVEYTMEMGNPMAMQKAGWNADTWSTGDRITWEGRHDSDPNRAYMGLNWAERQDGTRLYDAAGAQIAYLQEKGLAVPAYLTDEQPIVAAAALGEGFWSRTGPGGSRFSNIYGPEKAMDWPLTQTALDQVAVFTEADNPITDCVFNGPPRSIYSLGLWQWSQPDADTSLIDRDLWPEPRVIHLNGTGEMGAPSRYGFSVGHFDGKDLVVETTNFIEDNWGLYWGIDSSSQKTLTERYSLADDGMMITVEFTVTDPVYLTEPLTLTHQWAKQPDGQLTKAECSVETANYFLNAGYDE